MAKAKLLLSRHFVNIRNRYVVLFFDGDVERSYKFYEFVEFIRQCNGIRFMRSPWDWNGIDLDIGLDCE